MELGLNSTFLGNRVLGVGDIWLDKVGEGSFET
jgi:hypothetical protein